jgi:nucleoside-triphosphatase THEP1
MRSRPAPIFVITGERGAGKSTVCARVAEDGRRRGLSLAGLLTERGPDLPDRPDTRQVVDLAGGTVRPFGAHRRENEERECGPSASVPAGDTDPLTPGWHYEDEVFAWGNEVLRRAAGCDLLVIDEVGPLELRGSRGWVRALDVLCSRAFGAAVVVCRPWLVDELLALLGEPVPLVLEVTETSRDALPASIADAVAESVDR